MKKSKKTTKNKVSGYLLTVKNVEGKQLNYEFPSLEALREGAANMGLAPVQVSVYRRYPNKPNKKLHITDYAFLQINPNGLDSLKEEFVWKKISLREAALNSNIISTTQDSDTKIPVTLPNREFVFEYTPTSLWTKIKNFFKNL